jgi:hypothetical protein
MGDNTRNCERCKLRFKCYTTNTAERPKQVAKINFEVAKCCIRCKNGDFHQSRNASSYFNAYQLIGTCELHKVLIHQLSCCESFAAKHGESLTSLIRQRMYSEMQVKIHSVLPKYCLIDNK